MNSTNTATIELVFDTVKWTVKTETKPNILHTDSFLPPDSISQRYLGIILTIKINLLIFSIFISACRKATNVRTKITYLPECSKNHVVNLIIFFSCDVQLLNFQCEYMKLVVVEDTFLLRPAESFVLTAESRLDIAP